MARVLHLCRGTSRIGIVEKEIEDFTNPRRERERATVVTLINGKDKTLKELIETSFGITFLLLSEITF
ncbi:hypothetical protein M5K25_010247 [Dendrobium thyrsiflorum]|uniref:Uncharacterized protein n=1 Tax=Dendrobium thyrsiflorum TaxID=117978 RepID=A0ABD0V048_DENTH